MAARSPKSVAELLQAERYHFQEILRQKDAIVEMNKVESARLSVENADLRHDIAALKEQNQRLIEALRASDPSIEVAPIHLRCEQVAKVPQVTQVPVKRPRGATPRQLDRQDRSPRRTRSKDKVPEQQQKVTEQQPKAPMAPERGLAQSQQLLDPKLGPKKDVAGHEDTKSDLLRLSPSEVIKLFQGNRSPELPLGRKRSLSAQRGFECKSGDRSASLNRKNPGGDPLDLRLSSLDQKILDALDPQNGDATSATLQKPSGPNPSSSLIKVAPFPKSPQDTRSLSMVPDAVSPTTPFTGYEGIGLNKAYEDLFVFGCLKPRPDEAAKDLELDMTALFTLYSTQDERTQTTLSRLAKFVQPFGRKFRVHRLKNNFAKVQDALFANRSPFDFSFFSLHGDQTSGFRLTTREEEILRTRPGFDILRAVNPRRFYYYYCARVDDFFVHATSKAQTTDLLEFFFYPKAVIIKTLYPLTRLYQDFLTDALFELKQRRLAQFQTLRQGTKASLEGLQAIDGQAMLSAEIEFLVEKIELLDAMRITSNFGQSYSLGIQARAPLVYALPTSELTPFAECESAFDFVFHTLPFEDFLFVLLSLFAEKNLIFVSENLFALSACMSTFLALLRPLNWEFPVVYSLPDDLLMLLASPIPILVGLNLPTFQVVNDLLPEFRGSKGVDASNNVFVFLDEGLFHYEVATWDDIVLPKYKDTIAALGKAYQRQWNVRASNWFRVRKQTINNIPVSILKAVNAPRMHETLSKLENALFDSRTQCVPPERLTNALSGKRSGDFSIFFLVAQLLEGLALSRLRRNVSLFQGKAIIFSTGDVSVFDASDRGDVEFLRRLVRTQAFISYVDNEVLGVRSAGRQSKDVKSGNSLS